MASAIVEFNEADQTYARGSLLKKIFYRDDSTRVLRKDIARAEGLRSARLSFPICQGSYVIQEYIGTPRFRRKQTAF